MLPRGKQERKTLDNMAIVTVNINGQEFPCLPTMGALLRFKRQTGREITEMDNSLEDLCTYLWCCVTSAARREGKPFDMSLIDFADSITPEILIQWASGVAQPKDTDDGKSTGEKDEKKTTP